MELAEIQATENAVPWHVTMAGHMGEPLHVYTERLTDPEKATRILIDGLDISRS